MARSALFRHAAAAAFLVCLSGPGQAAPAEGREGFVCVSNGSGARLLFAAEIAPAPRRLAWVAPGGTLCAGPGTAETGIVSVFADATALEGCSRLARPGHAETLLAYADFDNCRWSGQD